MLKSFEFMDAIVAIPNSLFQSNTYSYLSVCSKAEEPNKSNNNFLLARSSAHQPSYLMGVGEYFPGGKSAEA
jgi:hypothetical protein